MHTLKYSLTFILFAFCFFGTALNAELIHPAQVRATYVSVNGQSPNHLPILEWDYDFVFDFSFKNKSTLRLDSFILRKENGQIIKKGDIVCSPDQYLINQELVRMEESMLQAKQEWENAIKDHLYFKEKSHRSLSNYEKKIRAAEQELKDFIDIIQPHEIKQGASEVEKAKLIVDEHNIAILKLKALMEQDPPENPDGILQKLAWQKLSLHTAELELKKALLNQKKSLSDLSSKLHKKQNQIAKEKKERERLVKSSEKSLNTHELIISDCEKKYLSLQNSIKLLKTHIDQFTIQSPIDGKIYWCRSAHQHQNNDADICFAIIPKDGTIITTKVKGSELSPGDIITHYLWRNDNMTLEIPRMYLKEKNEEQYTFIVSDEPCGILIPAKKP